MRARIGGGAFRGVVVLRGRSSAIVLLLGRIVSVTAIVGLLGRGSLPALTLTVVAFCACLTWWLVALPPGLGAPAAALGTLSGLAAIAAAALIPGQLSLRTPTLLEVALAVLGVVPVGEYLLRHAVAQPRLLLIGSSNSGVGLDAPLIREASRRFDVVGVLDESDLDAGTVTEFARTQHVDVVAIAAGLPTRELARSAVSVVDLAAFLETYCARLSPRAPGLAWGESGHERRPAWARARTRAFDLVVAMVGLVVTAPIWMIVALARRRDVLVRQVRVGEGGRPFTMLKLRTMRLDAEPDGRAVWAQQWDPRASLAGRIFRATHIDEIPQFWNVLRGEMSIVGPRPERPELTSMLEETIPNWSGRHAVKPGMTGWAQVCLDYAGDRDRSEQKLSYDLWYVRNGNVLVDLSIVLWTIPRTMGDCARTFVARRRAVRDETPAHATEPAAPAVPAPIRSAGSAA